MDEAYGRNENFVYLIEVEEEYKLDCIIRLKEALKPGKFNVVIIDMDGKSDGFKMEFRKTFDWYSKKKASMGHHLIFTDSPQADDTGLLLVVVFYASIPQDAFYYEGAFHVIFASPDERKSLIGVPELSALSFIYFKGG